MRLANTLVLIAGCAVGAASTACSDNPASTGPSSDSSSTAYSISLDTLTTADSSAVVVGSSIPVRVVVAQGGSAVAGASVAWTVGSGHGVLSSPTSITDSLGVAAVTWTVGDTVGLNSLTAVISSASVTLRAAGVADTPLTLMRVSADSVWLLGGATTMLTSRVHDRYGNAVDGAHVTWSASDGQLSTTESITGVSGDAESAFTAPAASGTFTITATLPGKASISFRVVSIY